MKISHKLAQFASQMGRGCSRPLYKFLRDMLTGMVAKKSIMLSDVGRALNEKTDLLYTEKRLSRNLTHGDLNDAAVRENYLATVRRDTEGAVIAFDLSDVRKEYSRSQPYLAGIFDDSRKEKAYGYWLTVVEAVRPDGKHVPLWLDAWSQKTPDFRSQNIQVIETIQRVAAHCDRSAIWVFDRGFDGPKIMAACEAAGITYVIRQIGKRTVVGTNGKEAHTYEIAARATMPYRFAWRTIRHSKTIPIEYRCGSAGVITFRDGRKVQLLAFQQGRFREPVMVITNCLDSRRETVMRLCLAYLKRWGVESGIRAIKQCFELENLRPLTWAGIQRITLLAFLAWAFLCKVAKTIGGKASKIFGLYKSFGETPEFFYYRLAEAVAMLLLLGRAGP